MNCVKLRIIAVVLMAACISHAAFAHAFLDKSDPKVGATVATSPTEVKIWFTDDIVPDKSSIQVFNAANIQVDKKEMRADPNDKSVLILSLPALPPGDYKVVWQALCPDTHHTNGTFEFTVKPIAATQRQ